MNEHSTQDTESLARDIEAFLFSEGGPVSRAKLVKTFSATAGQIDLALESLAKVLERRGLALVLAETEVSLAVAPASREQIERIYAEPDREIGDAGLEVLAILLYRGPSTRAVIEYIRGVNSSTTIRTLVSRGLVQRTENPDDAREVLYRPTAELLAYLGVTEARALPEYGTISGELAAFEKSSDAAGPFHAGDENEHTTE